MNRWTTYSACVAALAVVVFVVVMTYSLISRALPPGGGVGDPIVIDAVAMYLDSGGLLPATTGHIARGQTFWVRGEDIYDADTIGDPTVEMDEIVSAVWTRRHCPLGGSWGSWETVSGGTLENKGNNHYRSVLEQSLDTDGDYEYKLTVNDEGNPGNDDEVSETAQVSVLGVDYVIVVPNPTSVETGGSVDLTGKAYNMGGDDERHFDDSGEPIDGTADNDVQVDGTFTWTLYPYLGSLSLTSGPSTAFTAGPTTGLCTVTATYYEDPGNPESPTVSGSALVDIQGDWSVDLTGVNHDDVQNVPINAKAPAALDGTGSVGEMRAKVVIAGDPNTTYDVIVDTTSTKVSIVGAPTSLTTDAQGTAEQGFELHAQGTIPSGSLEDVQLWAEVWEEGCSGPGCGYMLALTIEDITVYRLELALSEVETAPAQTGNGEVDEENYNVGAWTLHDERIKHAADLICRRYAWFVTQPSGAYGGELKAELRLRQKFEDLLSPVCGIHVESRYPLPGNLGMSLDYGIVSVSVEDTSDRAAWASWKGEIRLKGTDGEWHDAPTAQTDCSVDGRDGDYASVTTSSSVETFACTYEANNPNSRAEARVRMSCVAAVQHDYIWDYARVHVRLEQGDGKQVVVDVVDGPIELVE